MTPIIEKEQASPGDNELYQAACEAKSGTPKYNLQRNDSHKKSIISKDGSEAYDNQSTGGSQLGGESVGLQRPWCRF